MPPLESSEIKDRLSATLTAAQWDRLGYRKRAGVAVPLFSLYSEKSQGIGDYTDLTLLADWCEQCGLTVIQLLPLNDVGFNFRPYDALSMFALEPMYISLRALKGVDAKEYSRQLKSLQQNFPTGSIRVNYTVKSAKLELLWTVFLSRNWDTVDDFKLFLEDNRFWIDDYALFKIIKQYQGDKNWEDWETPLRQRDPGVLAAFGKAHTQEVAFQKWLQWQAAAQLQSAKQYANQKGIYLMGDIPFLVSRDSADVWSRQEYFKLHLASGAPPDAYSAMGQRWGMPPYHWEAMAAKGYDYLIHKLKVAERFFDLYRIDHFVGVFRLWTIELGESLDRGGLNGRFDPADESLWEEHGRRLVEVMRQATAMLPCAEDLGVIPHCSYKILDKYGILGMDIQRWNRDWAQTFRFKAPEDYRFKSIAVISTHDMSSFRTWWEYEAGTVDEEYFKRKCEQRGMDFGWFKDRLFDPVSGLPGRLHWKPEIDSADRLAAIMGRPVHELKEFTELYSSTYAEPVQFWDYLGLPQPWKYGFSNRLGKAALAAINRSASMFSIQMMQDWTCMSRIYKDIDFSTYRINAPGTVSDENWTLVLPISLEQFLELPEK
ncbi:MAG: 4-alpha-glucanotransferase [Candidatus Firestonebacteria bacterium]|nr:4-alpha-glucanotransferase [Candidatus Firestonebacteria bacterium]